MVNWERIRRRTRLLYLRVLRQQGKPETIAGGVALGAFLGFLLPPGIQTIVALGLAPILRCNPIGAACGVWVTNPVTMPVIYPAALALGSRITGLPVREVIPVDETEFWHFMSRLPSQSRLVFIIGTGLAAMGAVSSFVLYYATKWLVIAYRGERDRRRKRKAAAKISS